MQMKLLILTAVLIAAPAFAQETVFYDPTIQHMPKDGIVTLYGAGGPNTAFQKRETLALDV